MAAWIEDGSQPRIEKITFGVSPDKVYLLLQRCETGCYFTTFINFLGNHAGSWWHLDGWYIQGRTLWSRSSKNPGVVDLIMLYLISNRLDCIKGLAGGMWVSFCVWHLSKSITCWLFDCLLSVFLWLLLWEPWERIKTNLNDELKLTLKLCKVEQSCRFRW